MKPTVKFPKSYATREQRVPKINNPLSHELLESYNPVKVSIKAKYLLHD